MNPLSQKKKKYRLAWNAKIILNRVQRNKPPKSGLKDPWSWRQNSLLNLKATSWVPHFWSRWWRLLLSFLLLRCGPQPLQDSKFSSMGFSYLRQGYKTPGAPLMVDVGNRVLYDCTLRVLTEVVSVAESFILLWASGYGWENWLSQMIMFPGPWVTLTLHSGLKDGHLQYSHFPVVRKERLSPV